MLHVLEGKSMRKKKKGRKSRILYLNILVQELCFTENDFWQNLILVKNRELFFWSGFSKLLSSLQSPGIETPSGESWSTSFSLCTAQGQP
jgi:hypothetical protein